MWRLLVANLAWLLPCSSSGRYGSSLLFPVSLWRRIFLQHLTFAWGNCRTTTVLAWRSQPYVLLSPHRLLLLSFLNSPAAVCLCVTTSPSVCLSRGDRRGSLGSQDYIHKTNDGDCLLLFGLLASCWKNKRPLYTFPPCVAAPLVSHLVEKGPRFLLNLIALRSWKKKQKLWSATPHFQTGIYIVTIGDRFLLRIS